MSITSNKIHVTQLKLCTATPSILSSHPVCIFPVGVGGEFKHSGGSRGLKRNKEWLLKWDQDRGNRGGTSRQAGQPLLWWASCRGLPQELRYSHLHLWACSEDPGKVEHVLQHFNAFRKLTNEMPCFYYNEIYCSCVSYTVNCFTYFFLVNSSLRVLKENLNWRFACK